MARELVDDALWEMVNLLWPVPPSRKTPAGRKRLDEWRIFTGHPVHPPIRSALANAPQENGMRLWYDMLGRRTNHRLTTSVPPLASGV